MAERMIFPKTIQEFIEEYSVTDENGSKLIPTFRMEQAHIYYGEQIRNRAIDEFAERIIELVDEFPTVEDEFGLSRPMTTNEMCNVIAEQMKGV